MVLNLLGVEVPITKPGWTPPTSSAVLRSKMDCVGRNRRIAFSQKLRNDKRQVKRAEGIMHLLFEINGVGL